MNVAKRTRHEGGRLDYTGLEMECIDETANRVSLAGMNGTTRVVHTFPLDCIRTAWSDPSRKWFLEVEHYFENRG